MKTPDEELLPIQLPLDDSQPEEVEQFSQQDIHSNGFDTEAEYDAGMVEADTDALDTAYEASEPAYTLDLESDGDDLDED
jgi:hypothetical protein